MGYKLVAVDMDGTLLNSGGQISERTKRAIVEAGKQGVYIVLATGRILPSALNYSRKIGLNKPIISSNGAIMVNGNKEIIYEEKIDGNDIEHIMNIGDRNGIYYHFYTRDTYYSNRYEEDIVRFYNPKGISRDEIINFQLYKDINEVIKKDILKFIFIEKNPEKIMKLRNQLDSIEGINICSSGRNNLEVMDKKVSKGNSLKYLCEKLEIPRNKVIAIGDNENDMEMVSFAGLGVSMGNGTSKIKAVSDTTTSSNDKDGVAKVIEKYIL